MSPEASNDARIDEKPSTSKAAKAVAALAAAEATAAVAIAEAETMRPLPLQVAGLIADLAPDGTPVIVTLNEANETRGSINPSHAAALALGLWLVDNYQEEKA